MRALSYYYAAMMIFPISCLINGVYSRRSLSQNEGDKIRNNDAIIMTGHGEERRHLPAAGHRHIVDVESNESTNHDNGEDDGSNDNDGDDDNVEWENKKEKGRQNGTRKPKPSRRQRQKKKMTKRKGRRRNRAKIYKSIQQKRPTDIVLMVDTSSNMWSWYMRKISRVQNITRLLALQFLENDHRNRIAIGQFDFSNGKIVLELGKWREPTINLVTSQLKCPGEYRKDESLAGGAEQFSAFTAALITSKKIFINSPRADNENCERIAILITDGMDEDRFDEAKIIRDQLNVRIMFVMVVNNPELAKKDTMYSDPNPNWRGVYKIVSDLENDIIWDTTGICSSDSDCCDGGKCFFPSNLIFGRNRGFCGCLPPGTTFDTKRYFLHDCCRTIPLPPYATPKHYYDECY